MEQNISQEKATTIYTVGILAIMLKALFNFSNVFSIPGILDSALAIVFICCMLYLIVTQIISTKTFVMFIVLALCLGITYYKVHYFYLITSFLSIWAINNVDIKKVLKKNMILVASFLIIHIALYIIVSIFNSSMIPYIYRNGVKRHFFFMSHPNTFSMFITWCIFEYIYLYYKKMDIIRMIMLIAICFVTKIFTDSNTALITTTIVLILLILDKYQIKFGQKITRLLSKYGFAFCSIFFAAITVAYTRLSGVGMLLYNGLNKAFTGRLLYGAYIYDTNGWTLFGRTLVFPEKIHWKEFWFDEILCDNTYILCFVCYGFFYMILLSIAFMKIEKKTSNIEKILIIAYIFYGSMEAYVLNAVFCFPLLFIGKYIFENKGENRLESKD